MDPSNLSRLKEEQEKVLAGTDEKIQQWEKFKSDYKALKDRLKTLPDKITHDVMVPFGPLAFMPGKLVHTNEIMVLLGDNWFVERSAKQAAAIVDRRMKSVNTELEALRKQRSLFEPRIDITSELKQAAESKDVFDITEEFDAVKEEKWREQHKINVQNHRKRMKEEMSKAEQKTESEKFKTDEELWSRLDELEKIERERREIERMPDEVVLGKDGSSSNSGSSGAESDDEGGDDDDDEEDDINFWGSQETTTSKISFTHTKMDKQVNFSQSLESSEDNETKIEEEEEPLIYSPADIYTKFGVKPKSILKESNPNRQKKSKASNFQRTEQKKVTESASHNMAFTGTIVEKKTETTALVQHVPASAEASSSNTTSQSEPPKRVSKFKAQRQKLTNS